MTGGNNFAFIDSQNLKKSIEKQGWELDYQRFRVYLKDKYRVEKAFLFYGYLKSNGALYNFLQDSDYTIIFKPLVFGPNGKPKGNIDAELVLHTMIQYPNFDQAIIVSGDGDFYCLADYLRQKNKLANIIVPNEYEYSKLLRPFMNEYGAAMSNLRKKLEYKKPPI